MAGDVVINASDDSARISKDFDIFHDSIEALAEASQHDVASLVSAGFEVEKLKWVDEWKQLAYSRKAHPVSVGCPFFFAVAGFGPQIVRVAPFRT